MIAKSMFVCVLAVAVCLAVSLSLKRDSKEVSKLDSKSASTQNAQDLHPRESEKQNQEVRNGTADFSLIEHSNRQETTGEQRTNVSARDLGAVQGRDAAKEISAQGSSTNFDVGAYALDGPEFPIDTVITDYCRQQGPPCDELYSLIAKLNGEPRDTDWSEKMESVLRKRIDSDESYKIRRLICRTTLCAVTIVSDQGVYIGGATYEFQQTYGVRSWVAAYGDEIDSTGVRHTISHYLVLRRK